MVRRWRLLVSGRAAGGVPRPLHCRRCQLQLRRLLRRSAQRVHGRRTRQARARRHPSAEHLSFRRSVTHPYPPLSLSLVRWDTQCFTLTLSTQCEVSSARAGPYNQDSICEISAAGVGFWGSRLRRRMTTLAAFFGGIYSQGRDFSNRS